MNQRTTLSLRFEMIWWLITLLVTAAVLYPILSSISEYPFIQINILYIVILITISRYIFLLKYTFLAKQQILKVILTFLCIPLIFYLVQELTTFQIYLDDNGFDLMLKEMPFQNRTGLASFIYNEMLFFGTGSIIATAIFPFRMLASVWWQRNRAGVEGI